MSSLRTGIRRLLSAYAAFGLTVVALLARRYVNVGRSVLSTDLIVRVGAVAAVVVYIGLFARSSSTPQ